MLYDEAKHGGKVKMFKAEERATLLLEYNHHQQQQKQQQDHHHHQEKHRCCTQSTLHKRRIYKARPPWFHFHTLMVEAKI